MALRQVLNHELTQVSAASHDQHLHAARRRQMKGPCRRSTETSSRAQLQQQRTGCGASSSGLKTTNVQK